MENNIRCQVGKPTLNRQNVTMMYGGIEQPTYVHRYERVPPQRARPLQLAYKGDSCGQSGAEGATS